MLREEVLIGIFVVTHFMVGCLSSCRQLSPKAAASIAGARAEPGVVMAEATPCWHHDTHTDATAAARAPAEATRRGGVAARARRLERGRLRSALGAWPPHGKSMTDERESDGATPRETDAPTAASPR